MLLACNRKQQCASKEEADSSCCYTPSSKTSAILASGQNITQRKDTSHDGMIWIAAGTYMMGAPDDRGMPNEYPAHKVHVNGFWMDATEVTNAQFAEFVNTTGYVTMAEHPVDWEILKAQSPPGTPKPADSLLEPGSMVFTATLSVVPLNDNSQWWRWVRSTDWRHPEGPTTNIKDRDNYPVVQVSWEDAVAYCKWAGKRLPTEAEWEWAASAGGKNLYAWGNEHDKWGSAANTWQGTFPVSNTKQDGYLNTAPVKSFAANGYGLYDMSGNVWEWCSDWYDPHFYSTQSASLTNDPHGPADAQGLFMKSIRGGSYLCNPSYCEGYRRSRRMYSSFDSATNHIGFRCVK